MLAPSQSEFTQADDINLETAQTSAQLSPDSQPHQFSKKNCVYIAHAILIVATLGLINWLSSASSAAPNLEFQLSQQWIDGQVTQD
ncbi:MAG: hypothetical protein WBA77_03565 [Microcoleaceae cyanobacterium]